MLSCLVVWEEGQTKSNSHPKPHETEKPPGEFPSLVLCHFHCAGLQYQHFDCLRCRCTVSHGCICCQSLRNRVTSIKQTRFDLIHQNSFSVPLERRTGILLIQSYPVILLITNLSFLEVNQTLLTAQNIYKKTPSPSYPGKMYLAFTSVYPNCHSLSTSLFSPALQPHPPHTVNPTLLTCSAQNIKTFIQGPNGLISVDCDLSQGPM